MDESKTFSYLEQLGRGAFGEVWLAEDPHNRRFAIKFISGGDPALRDRLALDHANALIRVNHPNVVRVFGIERLIHPNESQAGPRLAIVMEFLDGIPLSKHAATLPLAKVRKFSKDLAHGLNAMHEEGLLHDDLHAGNVMISGECAKLVDPLYTRSLMDVGLRTRQADKQSDVRSLVDVIRIIAEKCPEVDQRRLGDTHFSARAAATTPLEALRYFEILWPDQASVVTSTDVATEEIQIDGDQIYLALCRLDEYGSALQTHVIDRSGIRVTLPGLWMGFGDDVFEQRQGSRRFRHLREDILDEWHERGSQTEPSDYCSDTIAAPVLASLSSGQVFELSSDAPAEGSQEELFIHERFIGIQGVMGPYVFCEQADYLFAGGAHPDTTYSSLIVDVRNGLTVDTLLTPAEQADVASREAKVAQAMFALRDEERLFDEIEVGLAACAPHFRARGDTTPTMALLFTTSASYVQSDRRWSSYTISETVIARRACAAMAEVAAPLDGWLSSILAKQAGTPVGWSKVGARTSGGKALLARIARLGLGGRRR